MNNGLALSVLDLVGMHTGDSPGGAIARSVDLARHVEALGYKRFWLAEHHSVEGLACSATSVLIGHVAGATTTIRVGSGGIMLPNHAPLMVAEQFGTLEAMYPGRIDLGLGRAPGGGSAAMRNSRRWKVCRLLLRCTSLPITSSGPRDSTWMVFVPVMRFFDLI